MDADQEDSCQRIILTLMVASSSVPKQPILMDDHNTKCFNLKELLRRRMGKSLKPKIAFDPRFFRITNKPVWSQEHGAAGFECTSWRTSVDLDIVDLTHHSVASVMHAMRNKERVDIEDLNACMAFFNSETVNTCAPFLTGVRGSKTCAMFFMTTLESLPLISREWLYTTFFSEIENFGDISRLEISRDMINDDWIVQTSGNRYIAGLAVRIREPVSSNLPRIDSEAVIRALKGRIDDWVGGVSLIAAKDPSMYIEISCSNLQERQISARRIMDVFKCIQMNSPLRFVLMHSNEKIRGVRPSVQVAICHGTKSDLSPKELVRALYRLEHENLSKESTTIPRAAMSSIGITKMWPPIMSATLTFKAKHTREISRKDLSKLLCNVGLASLPKVVRMGLPGWVLSCFASFYLCQLDIELPPSEDGAAVAVSALNTAVGENLKRDTLSNGDDGLKKCIIAVDEWWKTPTSLVSLMKEKFKGDTKKYIKKRMGYGMAVRKKTYTKNINDMLWAFDLKKEKKRVKRKVKYY
eukprot:830894_1